MNCRDFHNEFEERAALSDVAMLHLDSCTNCQKFRFEQTRLWEMLGGLNRVEAPKDFDFQLKARIARSKPTDFQQTGLFPALRYVLPLSAILIVLSVVALSGLYFVDTSSLSPVAVSETPNPAVNMRLPEDILANTNAVAVEKNPLANDALIVDPNFEPSNIQSKTPNKMPEVAQKEIEGGSKDFPNSQPKTISPNKKDSDTNSRDIAGTNPGVINPRGIDPQQKVETVANPNFTKPSVKDSLNMLGIKTDSLKVVSINQNSQAERLGVKIGDVVEEINGKKISNDTLPGKQINIVSLTILRGGERIEINLANK